MPSSGGVTVVLPIFRAEPVALRDAFASIRNQSLGEIEIQLIVNGADEPTLRLTRELARADARARVIELPTPGLSAALNAGLRAARFDLVARMDADDISAPTRLAKQAAFMESEPHIAALGTASEGIDESGHFFGVQRPPTDPAEVRWRLCLGNPLCHGSMMLRRRTVLAIGGYDPACRFAQDYDLWLRLSREHDIANLPDVLYRYNAQTGRRHHEQARIAADLMVRHWASLPTPGSDESSNIAAAIAESTWGGRRAAEALDRLETVLRQGPTREALLAWQVIAQRAGLLGNRRHDRLRDAGERLRAAGVENVWLYGAGRHTAWLLENLELLGVGVEGLVDDALAGSERYGHTVASLAGLEHGVELVLSSDAHEDQLWDASLPARARGIRVWRVYGPSPADAGAGHVSSVNARPAPLEI